VKRVDLQHEEFLIPESVGLSLHRLDLVVGPLQGAGDDREVVPRQDVASMGGASGWSSSKGGTRRTEASFSIRSRRMFSF
jgi:hypothetical protein